MTELNKTNDGAPLENKDSKLDQIVEGFIPGEKKPDDNKQEDSKDPYAAELERVKAENAKQAEIIEHKNRAIEALKKKNNPTAEPVVPPIENQEDIEVVNGVVYKKKDAEAIKQLAKQIADEAIKPLQEQLNQLPLETALNQATDNPSERELIKYHLTNSIKPSGDLNKDIQNARLLANREVILSPENQEFAREEVLASLSASSGLRSNKAPSNNLSPASQQAADMLRNAGLGEVAKLVK